MNPPQQTDPPKCPICCGGFIPQVLLTQPVCVAWFCEKQIYFKIDGNNARLPMLWPSTNPGYGPSSTLTDIWFCTARWLIFPILTISCCNHCSLRMLYLLPPDQQPKPDSFSVHQVQGQKLNSSEYIPMCNRFSNGRPVVGPHKPKWRKIHKIELVNAFLPMPILIHPKHKCQDDQPVVWPPKD